MSRVILFNKPFRVMSQFREIENKPTLSRYFNDKSLRVAGRLDYDSEGLLILTDDGRLLQKITHPRFAKYKTYRVQVEGEPCQNAREQLRAGVILNDVKTQPARVRLTSEPAALLARDPPIRDRKSIPTHWLELSIAEGRNRQVRRMTAAVHLPTLRLIRIRVGDWSLGELQPGDCREVQYSN